MTTQAGLQARNNGFRGQPEKLAKIQMLNWSGRGLGALQVAGPLPVGGKIPFCFSKSHVSRLCRRKVEPTYARSNPWKPATIRTVWSFYPADQPVQCLCSPVMEAVDERLQFGHRSRRTRSADWFSSYRTTGARRIGARSDLDITASLPGNGERGLTQAE